MRVILLQNADENEKRYITWITSMYSGMIYFSGPIASFIVYKYGCRVTVIIGASLEVIGFILCFFVRDIRLYIISYSVLAGIGSGLTYTAILVLVSFNFDRYLSLATGIAVSGQGAGLIVMPIVCNFIYEKYELQPSFLIIAGVSLQKWVLGALMRPSSFELDQLSKSRNSKKVNGEMHATKEKEFAIKKSFKTETKNNDGEKVFCPGIISDVELLKEESNHKQFSAIFTSEFEVKVKTRTKFVDVISGQDNMSYNFDEVENTKQRYGVGNTLNTESKKENNISHLTGDGIKKPGYSNISENFLSENKMADMSVKFPHDDETKNNSSVKMAANVDEVENKTRASISYGSKQNPYLMVLKNRKFIFFLLGFLLYTVPEEIIYMLYPKYVSVNGASQSEMSNLLSIIGIFSTTSRLLMGVIANSKIVDIYILYTMPFVLLGVATLLLPYYVHAFVGRVFYAVAFGLYNTGVNSLLNEIISKITGKDNIPAAFGYILLLRGTSGVFAPPLADAIQTYAENPDASFIFAGSVYTMCLLMIVLLSWDSEI